jgi:hypothetical protein
MPTARLSLLKEFEIDTLRRVGKRRHLNSARHATPYGEASARGGTEPFNG